MNWKKVIAILLTFIMMCTSIAYAENDANTGGSSTDIGNSTGSGKGQMVWSQYWSSGMKVSLLYISAGAYDGIREKPALSQKTPTSIIGDGIPKDWNERKNNGNWGIAPIYFIPDGLQYGDKEIGFDLNLDFDIYNGKVNQLLINKSDIQQAAKKITYYNSSNLVEPIFNAFNQKANGEVKDIQQWLKMVRWEDDDTFIQNIARNKAIYETILYIMEDKHPELTPIIDKVRTYDADYCLLIEPLTTVKKEETDIYYLITPTAYQQAFLGDSSGKVSGILGNKVWNVKNFDDFMKKFSSGMSDILNLGLSYSYRPILGRKAADYGASTRTESSNELKMSSITGDSENSPRYSPRKSIASKVAYIGPIRQYDGSDNNRASFTSTYWGWGIIAASDYVFTKENNRVPIIEDDPTPTPEPIKETNISGKIDLSEKRITKAFDLNNIGGAQKFKFSYKSAGSHYHSNWVDTNGDGIKDTDRGSDRNRSSAVDSSYKYVIEHSSLASSVFGTLGEFIARFAGTNIKSGTASWSGGSDTVTPNLFYTVWRASDIPTIASYKEKNNNSLIPLGLGYGKTPQKTRNSVGGYTKSLSVSLDKSNGDYSTSFTDGDSSNTQSHYTSDQANYNATLAVHSYIGKQNAGDTGSSYSSNSFKIGGITFNKAKGVATPSNNLIKFYPYVQMAYEYFTDSSNSSVRTATVDVLAAHESSLKPVDYVEVGWYNPSPSNSLEIGSNQWSTHLRAINKWGKNNVLPGGALYTLNTKDNTSKLGVTTWQTYIPQDQINNVTAGGSFFNLADVKDRDTTLNTNVKNSVEHLDVVQYLQRDTTQANAFGGLKLTAAGGQDLGNGIKTSNDAKYWLKRATNNTQNANEADLDVDAGTKYYTYYKIKADVTGLVTIQKSTDGVNWGASIQNITKSQDASDITNAEVSQLDNRTKAVTNMLLALDRNKGNDTTLADSKWYNEAWDGLVIAKIDTIHNVGLFKPGIRSAAIDPKLCPVKDSTSDAFTKVFISQFRLNDKSSIHGSKAQGFVSTFNGKDIILPQMENMYQSRRFFITNATVMDN